MTPLQAVQALIAMHYFRLVAADFPDGPVHLDLSSWLGEPA